MMKKYNFGIVLFLFFSFLSVPTCEAQILDKLQKRAEDRAKKRVEQKVESRVDKAVDKTVDAPENAVKENKKSKKSDKKDSKTKTKDEQTLDLSSLMNASKDVKLPSSYEFGHKVSYVIKDASSSQNQNLTYWFGADQQIFGLETGDDTNTFIVYDLKQDAMVMFSEKDKKVQVISFGMFGAIYDNSDDDDLDFTFKKTSETKKISGYNCQKYVMISESMDGEFWFTNDVDLKIADFSKTFISMGKSSKQRVPEINADQMGFMIEMRSKDKSTNAVTQMTVKEIVKTNRKVVSSQYKKQ